MIKNIPLEENPREKVLSQGVETLSDVELLAIMLRTGNKEESVLSLAKRIIETIGGLSHLSEVSYGTLTSFKGIKKAKAIEILTIMEIAKRAQNRVLNNPIFSTPQSVYEFVKDELESLKQEHFVILILNHKNALIRKKLMYIGSQESACVSIREVFHEVVSVNGSRVILIHNHPSGEATASKEDRMLTQSMIESGELMNIEVLDHIVIGWKQYYSIVGERLYFEE